MTNHPRSPRHELSYRREGDTHLMLCTCGWDGKMSSDSEYQMFVAQLRHDADLAEYEAYCSARGERP